MKRNVKITLLNAAVCAALVNLSVARADDGEDGGKFVRSGMVACLHDGTVLGGVNQCGKIWQLAKGEASLSKHGHLKVSVRGLVLNDASTGQFNGTPDGVTGLVAAVICGGSGGTVVAQTAGVPLSQAGNARISATITLPERCVAPVIVVREIFDGAVGGWLAGTGF
jgi:hypothetical protein